jgi:hypothetical protein
MAATPFKISMVGALGNPAGPKKIFPLTVSDVNGEFCLFPSGASEVVLNGSNDVYITDMILSAAGVDTSQLEFFINGMAEGTKLLGATSIATTVARPFQMAPLRIPRGSMIKIKQLT